MQTYQKTDWQNQIEEASKRATIKRVFYLFDDMGYRHILGVFSDKKAAQIRTLLRRKNLINRLTEFEVKTTEPDTSFRF